MANHVIVRPEQVAGLHRVIYILIAFVLLLLGLLGVLLPGVPTTPFLLLMSYFLVRSWPSLYDRLLDWPLVGRPLRDWRENRGVARRTKIIAYAMVCLVITVTMFSPDLSIIMKLSTTMLAILGMAVVWKLPSF